MATRTSQLYADGRYYQAGYGPVVLSGGVASNVGSTTADLVITVDVADGTLYTVATASATPPSKADIIAGTGVAAQNAATGSSGEKTLSLTDLTPEATYYLHSVHVRSGGWESAIDTTDSFTMGALVAPGQVTGFALGTPGSNSIPASWTAVAGAETYEIYTSADVLVKSGIVGTSTDAGPLDPETAYTLKCRARNAGGAGPFSATDTATTTAAPDFQVASGHYEGVLSLGVVYPRPDAETNTWARHRHAYPGIKYEIPIGVQFGSWPYKYEMISGPSWLSIEAETLSWDGVDKFVIPTGYGVLSGTAPATPAAAETVTVRVYDQEHGRPSDSYVDVVFSVAVSADNFVFVDPVGGDDTTGDGTLANPYKEIITPDAKGTHANEIMVIRETPALGTDDNSTTHGDVANTWSGGYIPANPGSLSRPLDTATDIGACIGYPGETVVLNMRDWNGFGRVITDGFLSNIEIAYCHQDVRSLADVKVILSTNRTQRSVVWKVDIYRPYGGVGRTDNHGGVYLPVEGNCNDYTGHDYFYMADCEGNRLNYDPMSGGGYGTNGAHFVQTYTASRGLLERNTVRNSRIINNQLIGPKASSDLFEVRANDTTDNNIGTFHIRTASITSSGSSQVPWGFTRNTVFCFNKVGDLTNTGAAVKFSPSTPEGDYHWEFHVYRNSMPGDIDDVKIHSPLIPLASHNVCNSVGDYYTNTDNLEMGGARSTHVDDDMNLVGASRTSYLGIRGAEVA